MAGLASTGESQVIAAIIGGALTATGCFIGLHTADPGTTTIANEVSGGAYARQSATITNSGNNPTVGSNSGVLTYPTATANWGTISFFSVNGSVTAGNFIGGGALTTSKAVNNGDTARFAIGALTITVN